MNLRETTALIWGLAWRNVWRNKRRSFLTFLTIMAGCAMILFMRSLQNGGYEQMIEDSVAYRSGHIQIHEKGYWQTKTLEYAFKDDVKLTNSIRKIKGVKELSRRISGGALITKGDSSKGAEILGIEPSAEKRIITLHNYILPGGEYIEDHDAGKIVMGSALAKSMGVNTGGSISIVSQGFDGSIAAGTFTVKGLFKCPNREYNRSLILMPFDNASEFFTMMGHVSSYVVRVRDIIDSAEVRKSIDDIAGDELEVLSWEKLIPEIIQMIAMDRASSHIFVFILYVIVAFGILNTIQMSVFERTRELGIMLAIGTGPRRIFSMVMAESFIITLIGILAGLLTGWALSYYFTIYPMDFSKYQAEMEMYGVSTLIYYAKIRMFDFARASVIVFILSLIFTIFPARRASNLRPVKAIRQL